MNTYTFVRHGQSKANADKIIADENSPLTVEGRAQAKVTASSLINDKIARIVCSPLVRARETAKIIATELGISPATITIIDILRERDFGPLKNEPKTHDSPWYYDTDMEGVETRQALYERMQQCLSELANLSGSGNVLVVGHAVSGFYLIEASKHRASVDDFESSFQIGNAEPVLLDVSVA